jgi:hypothetical protein
MDSHREQAKDRSEGNGRIKGTSAFNIKEANHAEEISWSNNKFESTFNSDENELKDKNCSK